jgi:histidine triad (HIT) family protein
MNDCLICRKHRSEFPAPGGAIFQDELVYASHAHLSESQNQIYLGWLVVETRRHIPGLGDLNDQEAQATGLLIGRLSRALKAIQDAEHVYLFVLGHGVPHLHIHLLPRYPDTPRKYWGTNIDEWPEAPQGDRLDIEELCMRLRSHLDDQGSGIRFGEVQYVKLMSLRPNNWYLHADKLMQARAAWAQGKGEQLPPALVSRIDGQLSLIDGHARTFAAYESGATHIRAKVTSLEEIQGSSSLYRHIHRSGPAAGIKRISDLSDRILSAQEHERLWVGFCRNWLKENQSSPNT